jgi:hypothetical protein
MYIGTMRGLEYGGVEWWVFDILGWEMAVAFMFIMCLMGLFEANDRVGYMVNARV